MDNYSREGPKNSEEGNRYRLICGTCDRETVHVVVRSAEYRWNEKFRDHALDGTDEYQVVECQGCETVSFRHCSYFSEDWEVDAETGEFRPITRVRLYPSRLKGRKELEHLYRLPQAVRHIYEETLAAITNMLPILTGIGIRALVEAMSKERSAKGSNLEARLDDLVVQGVVTKAGAEILHSLRIMGNTAAHEASPPTLADLNAAFDAIEHALIGVYILPRVARRLPKRTGGAADDDVAP
jgi:hypothetical protein